ncbi:lamin tail domain-containing protein [Endomicrobium sp. AH-315-J14]|nr:lamin tail domain-containing protein [Endomicrobium sp. AH-315-J14]
MKLLLLSCFSILTLVAACGSEDTTTSGNDDDNDDTSSSAVAGSGGASSGSGSSQGGADVGAGGMGSTGAVPNGEYPLIINEIMYNPDLVTDELGEYVEIYNAGDKSVDLAGVVLKDETDNEHTIEGPLSIAPGDFLVLGRNGDKGQNGDYTADYVYGEDFRLSNASGDAVILLAPNGDLIDSVLYKNGGDWPSSEAGFSLELAKVTDNNDDGGNWNLATQTYGEGDHGTPGKANGGTENSGFSVDDTVGNWQNQGLKASLRFAPLDDVEDHVLEELNKATKQIRLAFFNVRLPAVKSILTQKTKDGVDVHVILDKKQQDLSYNTMGEDLEKAGVKVTMVENLKAEKSTMHDKFTVIDGETVLMGSANYSYTAMNVSDEDLLTIEDSAIAQRFLDEFDELLVGGNDKSAPYNNNEAIQAWMGPEDSIYKKVNDALDGAKSHVLLSMFQLNTPVTLDKIIDAHNRGVAVVVILDADQADQPDSDADDLLTAAGVSLILADNKNSNFAEMHSKFVVVDHKLLIMGSYNWTALGSFFNDENLMVIRDEHLADRAEGKFAEMLDAYNSPSPGSLGLDSGKQDVTFEVGNVDLDPGVKLRVSTVGGGPIAMPVELNGSSVTVKVESGTRLEYRYEVFDVDGTLLKEAKKHYFTVPYATGPFVLKDSFQK